jgi:branched-chain amino acid transport system permease protein
VSAVSTDRSVLGRAVRVGLVFGVVGVYLAMVGLLLLLNQRAIIVNTISLGLAVLLLVGAGAGLMAARSPASLPLAVQLGLGLLAGAIAGTLVALLTLAMTILPLQSIFIALSPALLRMLTLGEGMKIGPVLLISGGAITGLAGALLHRCPAVARRPVLIGFADVVVFGVFQELIQLMMQSEGVISDIRDFIYTWEGLNGQGALAVFVAGVVLTGLWEVMRGPLRRRTDGLGPGARQIGRLGKAGVLLLLLILLPLAAGSYIGQVLMLVGLYILMGMGLNLEIGLAGLLDLGFVAFFAVGAYTTALLTADSGHALAALSFWEAMPIAVLCSVIVGVLFGIPVLGVRGDYLAVATMGLGEIVRVIVASDFAAPLLGGAQGILQIPKPSFFGIALSGPVQLFYLTLVCSGIAAYIAWRLENSRLGRAWTALRDDEDVAQALGINLIQSKLLAYGLGAAFAGLAGSIFAVMLSSVYPSSFQLLISINVLALIIVGGMGSLPGVILGSVVLIGLPELLREFGEYRYLFYSVVLVVMMRLKPEGLWPSEVRRRELHSDDETTALDAGSDLLPSAAE